MARRRRRRLNPTTPEGAVLGTAAIGGLLASLYYAVTAVGTSMNPSESRRRAMLSGGILLGTMTVFALTGEASARLREGRAT